MLEGSQGVADVEEKVFFLGVEGHKKKLEQKENKVNSLARPRALTSFTSGVGFLNECGGCRTP